MNIMILEKGIKIYDNILEKCVNSVNEGWLTSYKKEDIAGVELFSERTMFVHFNKENYTEEAYPIKIEIQFRQ